VPQNGWPSAKPQLLIVHHEHSILGRQFHIQAVLSALEGNAITSSPGIVE
jgi:hypothetical protein